jgi:hypothetical protein
MIKLLGVGNSAPATALPIIERKLGVTTKFVKSGQLLQKPFKTTSLIAILSIGDLVRNLKVLNKSQATVVVFSSPIRLSEIGGITPLDYKPSKEFINGFTLENLDEQLHTVTSAKAQQVTRLNINHLDIMEANIKENSLLAPLMTFIYALPNQYQVVTKRVFADSVINGNSWDALERNLLKELGKSTLTSTQLDELYDLYNSTPCLNLIDGFTEYSNAKLDGRKVSVPKLAELFSFDAYEFKYLISISTIPIKMDKARIG